MLFFPGGPSIKCSFSLETPPFSFPLKMGLINKEKWEKENEDSGGLSLNSNEDHAHPYR